jgi:hypothetical protein
VPSTSPGELVRTKTSAQAQAEQAEPVTQQQEGCAFTNEAQTPRIISDWKHERTSN